MAWLQRFNQAYWQPHPDHTDTTAWSVDRWGHVHTLYGIGSGSGSDMYKYVRTTDDAPVLHYNFPLVGGPTGIAVAPNGDIYLSTSTAIYKQTAGVGAFVEVPGTTITGGWGDVTAAPNGDVYGVGWSNYKYYKQDAGTEGFVEYASSAGVYVSGMGVDQFGNIWIGGTGDLATRGLWKKNASDGIWTRLSTSNNAIFAVCCAPNGDVYGAHQSGYMYYLAAGSGTPVALTASGVKYWTTLCAAPNGDIFAGVNSGVTGLYKRAGGTGDFTLIRTNIHYALGVSW